MNTHETDVLIIGGGCSGSAAGIQAARLGVRTLIIEETPWLGGMITSAGVSAFDGNKYAVGGGIFGELRKKIEDHYGGPDKTFTGWISLTCFEPKIGKNFLHELAAAEKMLDIWFGASFVSLLKEGDTVTGAIVRKADGGLVEVRSKVLVEATEYGDVLKAAGVPYRLGRDAKHDTGEEDAPVNADGIVQDMTFCAILKKFEGIAPPVPASPMYNPELFINSTSLHASTTDERYLLHVLHDWESFITYAALPNDKYLLNWPFHSNDYPTTTEIYEHPETRAEHYRKAKELTLDFVHYMQTRLQHPEWGIATDEYPTEDALPFIPYVRESRRGHGKYLMVEKDVVPAPGSFRPPLRKDSVAVGDYFLDHHHSLFFIEPAEERLHEKLPPNAHFQIPFGCLLPANVQGLILAEKSISVSHIVNGCSRLQPVVMLIGQAAGVMAAEAVRMSGRTEEISPAVVQDKLLNAGCQLFPYIDVWNDDPDFKVIQEAALVGIYPEEKDFSFRGETVCSEREIEAWTARLADIGRETPEAGSDGISRREFVRRAFSAESVRGR